MGFESMEADKKDEEEREDWAIILLHDDTRREEGGLRGCLEVVKQERKGEYIRRNYGRQ